MRARAIVTIHICARACLLEYEVKRRGRLKAGEQVQTCARVIAGVTIAFKGPHGGAALRRDDVIATPFYIF